VTHRDKKSVRKGAAQGWHNYANTYVEGCVPVWRHNLVGCLYTPSQKPQA